MPANKRRFRIPAGVTLRECSVVIIGSTCKICGKDFKCESDVTLHKRWRHNRAIGPLIESLNNESYFHNIGQNCDICGAYLVNITDLKIHKRLIHKHRRRKKKIRKETVHVTFKLQGVTIMDVNLNRKYLKVQENLRYSVDADTQTPNWFDKHSDDCAGNIDLFLRDPVVNDSRIEYGIWPHRVNRYFVGKFASTKDDTIESSTNIVGRSLAEILNMSHRNTIISSNSYKEYESSHDSTSKEHTNVLLENLTIHDKENSQRIDNAYSKERERRKVHCQSEILDDSKEFPICQSIKPEQIVPSISKQNSWSSKHCHDPIRRPNKVAGYKSSVGLTSSVIDSVEIGNKNNNFGDATKKHTPLSWDNGRNEFLKADLNVDDDVQEVLRITRGNAQNDINHESPNRTEREMLVQNSAELYMLSMQEKSTMYPEKCNAGFTTNVESSDYLPFTRITESSYQFLANSFDKKLGIYLEDLHHYGIKCYENLPEINNNNLEEYDAVYNQDFLNPWMQTAESRYTNGLRANGNEVTIVLD